MNSFSHARFNFRVVEVQQLLRPSPSIHGHIPNPRRYVTHHQIVDPSRVPACLLSVRCLISHLKLFARMKQLSKAFFPGISRIQYEGPASKNPLAFKHYNPEELVAGKPMKDHLRFSVTYWHTIRGQLGDMFGVGTAVRPWEDGTNSMKMAETRVRVAFEFLEKLGAPFYAFHDRDVAPEGKSFRETNRNLDAIVKVLKQEQQRAGVQLLWGTACLADAKVTARC